MLELGIQVSFSSPLLGLFDGIQHVACMMMSSFLQIVSCFHNSNEASGASDFTRLATAESSIHALYLIFG